MFRESCEFSDPMFRACLEFRMTEITTRYRCITKNDRNTDYGNTESMRTEDAQWRVLSCLYQSDAQPHHAVHQDWQDGYETPAIGNATRVCPPRASDDDPCGQTRVAFPEEFGKESKATYYHQFKENMPFFIDYAFTNIQTFAFEIGKWDKSESDHCPLMIVLWHPLHKSPFARPTLWGSLTLHPCFTYKRARLQMEHRHQRTVLELRHFTASRIVHQCKHEVPHARCRQAFQCLQIVEVQDDALYAWLYHNRFI